MFKITVDAMGLSCPLPVVNAKKASENLKEGEKMLVLVDNEIAVQNLEKFAKQRGFESNSEKVGEGQFKVYMTVGKSLETIGEVAIDSSKEEEAVCSPDGRKKGMVIALTANVMGGGDEKLGTSLMKAFVFAVTKQDFLPETIVCYNTGAYLTCEGADTLEDMKTLEAAGVNILTCGTCLDFYNIKDKLAVGTVTNMYEIVEVLENAKSIVRP